MKNITLLSLLILITLSSIAKVPSHEIWDGLVKKYVLEDGLVDYKGFIKEQNELGKYLDLLSKNAPEKDWSDEEQIAYWINAYNAFTIKLVIDNYPLESIKNIKGSVQIPFVNTPWDIKFIEIGGETYDLNNIEHGILRKDFEEPRIHFAVNCASMSCPKLRREAFTADKLDQQLEDQGREFMNDPTRNKITEDKAQLSKIFKWFTGDFKDKGSVIDFVNKYADVKAASSAKISYLDYDWSLNDIE
ncbi:MAG: DUF547 domain-containing protein [Bacteroidota bacterium]